MKIIVNLIKIIALLALVLAVAASALVGYDRYIRNKYPMRYITPNQGEDELGF